MCWRLMSCGGKGAHPSAVPEQSPTSCLKCSWAERSRAARGLRGKGICLQRFNSEISSTGTFLVSPWPCGGTSHSQMGRFPGVFESPWKRLSKLHPFYAMKWETERSLKGSAPTPLPTCMAFVLHFFSLLTFHLPSLPVALKPYI